ncbi:MAG: PEP-CTERM sorting domain-containing protein [Planctomycetes bacterium]|nr:PEP-CTERM sorting domain-containing protein [Planctomycetota bacterium]
MLLGIPACGFVLPGRAVAVTFTWDNGAATSNWNTSDANWTGSVWANSATNDAVFDATGVGTISLTTAITGRNLTFNTSGYVIQNNTLTLGAGTTITTGSGLSSTINSAITSTGGLSVQGSGTLNLGGLATLSGGNVVLGTTSSGGNILNVANGGRLIYNTNQGLDIGTSSDSSNNKLNVSTPGINPGPPLNVNSAASINIKTLNLGTAANASGNQLNITNGAYVARNAGAGQGAWVLGTAAGADNNSITISGAGSTANMSFNTLRQFLTVGTLGSGNFVKAELGGQLGAYRLQIAGDVGVGGGDNNYVLITGASSSANIIDMQTIFNVGNSTGATGNSFRIENGAAGTITNSADRRRTFSIGGGTTGNGSDNNYLRVTGASSTLNINYALPLTVGGQVSSNNASSGFTVTVSDSNVPITNTATDNHIDVYNGGTLTLGASTSLYVMGVDSVFNLGDGNALSTATVGGSTDAGTITGSGETTLKKGVYLKNSSGKMVFNNGRLIAASNDALISGLGLVELDGTARVSTTQTLSTISNQITGTGDFHKEGAGTLALTNTSLLTPNNYTGDTYVDAGVLRLDTTFLDDLSSVYLYSAGSAKMNLNFAGSDTIGALYLDDILQAPGTYGRTGSAATNQSLALDAFFNNFPLNTFGFGILNVESEDVEAVPEPSALALAALGLLGVSLISWQRKRIACPK